MKWDVSVVISREGNRHLMVSSSVKNSILLKYSLFCLHSFHLCIRLSKYIFGSTSTFIYINYALRLSVLPSRLLLCLSPRSTGSTPRTETVTDGPFGTRLMDWRDPERERSRHVTPLLSWTELPNISPNLCDLVHFLNLCDELWIIHNTFIIEGLRS